MTQPEIIARQQRLIRDLRAATAERAKAEERVAAKRAEALQAAATRTEDAQEQVKALLDQAGELAGKATREVALPRAAWSPAGAQGEPRALLRESVARANLALGGIQGGRAALRALYARRHAARVLVMLVVTTLLVVLALLAGHAWNEVQRTQQAQATATAAEARAQATATAAEARAQATATGQAMAQATVEARAQAMSRQLGVTVPGLAFTGLKRNADWTPVIYEFNGVPMALVPAGCFEMGGDSGDSDERPVHRVCFEEPFWIDVYEVTNEQFARLGGVAAQGSIWTEAQRPRESITWDEAAAFCQQRGARLPTEAEWEYAARGPDALVYPWGNEFVKDNAVYDENSQGRTWDVGSKPGGASWVGALDMSGNVWEWVNDWYAEDYYSRSPQVNPQGPSTGERRVLRGGSWYSGAGSLRAAYRSRYIPGYWNDLLGFRCAFSH